MNDIDKKKLQGILRKIDSLKREVEELIGGPLKRSHKKTEISEEASRVINSINSVSTIELEACLSNLDHKDLGDVFVGVGGTSGDKRKPKAWLIERIIWLSKEFSEGHKSIRDS
jgi:hypothetical protein